MPLRFSHLPFPAVALGAATALVLFAFYVPLAVAQDAPREAPKLAEDIHETIVKVPVTVRLLSGKSQSGQMVLTHFRPDGDGPFPIVVFQHGRTSAKEKRAETPRFRYTSIARYWVRRGFAVFVPTRLGYGDSGLDPDPEFAGLCRNTPNFRQPLGVIAEQTSATLKFAKSFPWADTTRVVVAGQSYGGFGTIHFSGQNFPGVIAAVNFAGGVGGDREKNPRKPCDAIQITTLAAESGKRATIPMLWLYAENDNYWGSDWPRKWHAAYTKAGGRAEMRMFPPVSDEGHYLINRGFRLWRPVVDGFMEKLGFPSPKSKDAPQPTDFARIHEADKLPYVKETVKSDGYQKFLDADLPRAFVVSTTGGWASRTGNNAHERALQWCKENSKGSCHLYAVDDTVVFKPPATAAATAAP